MIKKQVCSGIIINYCYDLSSRYGFEFAYIPRNKMLKEGHLDKMIERYISMYQKQSIEIIGDLIIDRLCKDLSRPKAAMLIVRNLSGHIVSLVRGECLTDPDVKMEILALLQLCK